MLYAVSGAGEDHPRVCGEKSTVLSSAGAAAGSPPRMRGKVPLGGGEVGPDGITPAYAGKRWCISDGGYGPQDHPRVCGEKSQELLKAARQAGSPPRMRGKAPLHRELELLVGITPAYAGKSVLHRCRQPALWDHPRVCGEKLYGRRDYLRVLGSPPRMRGKVKRCFSFYPVLGITPAYAGKRLKRSRSTVPHAAIVPLFPSVCNKPAGSDGSPAGHDAPPFLPIENAVPASPAYNLRSL